MVKIEKKIKRGNEKGYLTLRYFVKAYLPDI